MSVFLPPLRLRLSNTCNDEATYRKDIFGATTGCLPNMGPPRHRLFSCTEVLSGVVAESLFCGWDPNTRQYRRVAHRAWLLKQLHGAKDRYRLPVTVSHRETASWRDKRVGASRRWDSLTYKGCYRMIPWWGAIRRDGALPAERNRRAPPAALPVSPKPP
jgi:hypothetical protein